MWIAFLKPTLVLSAIIIISFEDKQKYIVHGSINHPDILEAMENKFTYPILTTWCQCLKSSDLAYCFDILPYVRRNRNPKEQLSRDLLTGLKISECEYILRYNEKEVETTLKSEVSTFNNICECSSPSDYAPRDSDKSSSSNPSTEHTTELNSEKEYSENYPDSTLPPSTELMDAKPKHVIEKIEKTVVVGQDCSQTLCVTLMAVLLLMVLLEAVVVGYHYIHRTGFYIVYGPQDLD